MQFKTVELTGASNYDMQYLATLQLAMSGGKYGTKKAQKGKGKDNSAMSQGAFQANPAGPSSYGRSPGEEY